MGGEEIRAAYYMALDRVGLKGEGRRARGIVFHSLRYWYNTQLRGAIPENVPRRFTGHHSAEMTDLYDAEKGIDFQKARARLEELAAPQQRQ